MASEKNYVEANLPQAVIKKLESGAFRSLCEHLRERSDEVPNIDMMTVSGFCRNCLSKWIVVEARKLSDSIQKKASNDDGGDDDDETDIIKILDAMGYDEASQYVYGMMYPDWKKRHAQKASDKQMEKFNNSKPLWAKHDKQVLAKRAEAQPPEVNNNNHSNDGDASAVCNLKNHENNTDGKVASSGTKTSLLSNVCCEDIDNIDNTKTRNPQKVLPTTQTNNTIMNNAAFVPPDLPPISFSLGILTVSDRAFSGDYPSGDLSGPAVREVVNSILENSNSSSNNTTKTDRIETTIVPDEIDAIQTKLIDWTSSSSSSSSQHQPLDLILTTGGTGFSPRDVTPEATSIVVERSCETLMSFCSLALQSVQPLAALSRGTAGVKGTTLIANLPGNPRAVKEILPIFLPLALQAVADMKAADR